MRSKSDLIDAVAREANLTKIEAKRAVDATIAAMQEFAMNGGLRIAGFGTFQAKDRPSRAVRNPRTGGMVTTPATRVVRFKPGAGLKVVIG